MNPKNPVEPNPSQPPLIRGGADSALPLIRGCWRGFEPNEQPATKPLSTLDPWQELKRFTSARIALGRVGSSLPTREVLDFGIAHAMARDAVHLPLDADALEAGIQSLGFTTLRVHSKAQNRQTYLLRPDFGRSLDDESKQHLPTRKSSASIDLLFVIGDGLSALAIQRHAAPLLAEIQNCIPAAWKVGPVVIAEQARVALADEIGEIMGAHMVAILIGERPGLSSPDSLGIYLTYAPRVGRIDAERNCISNVRPQGLHYAAAAKKLVWLAQEAMELKLTGVALNDESEVREVLANNT
ncbi:MAG: ethanolamine ammonia-lyase subunit EutC [Sideroxydans sp.]|nr:ethanolamine ammonia-lyase subunit EutC [Sideroxydans sp.]